jgi:hypothetical protein
MANFIDFEDALGGLDVTEPTSPGVLGTLEPIFTMMVLLSPNSVSLKFRLDCEPTRGDWMWRRDTYHISGIVGTMKGQAYLQHVEVIDLLEEESLTFHGIEPFFLLPRLKTLRAANVRSHRLTHSGMVRPEWYRWQFGERRSALENLVLLSSAAYPKCMEELLRPLDNLKMLACGHQSRRDFGPLPWKSNKASWDIVMSLQPHLNRLESWCSLGNPMTGAV